MKKEASRKSTQAVTTKDIAVGAADTLHAMGMKIPTDVSMVEFMERSSMASAAAWRGHG